MTSIGTAEGWMSRITGINSKVSQYATESQGDEHTTREPGVESGVAPLTISPTQAPWDFGLQVLDSYSNPS